MNKLNKKKVEDIAYKIPVDGKIKIVDSEVAIIAMPFEYEKRFLYLIGELLNKTIKTKTVDQEAQLSTVLAAIRDLVTDSLSFEWLEILPDLVKIISDSYQLGYTNETIKDKMSIPQMVEVVLCQFECDRTSSQIAADFFHRIIGKIPNLEQITTLLSLISQITISQNTSSLKNSQNDMESLQPA